MVVEMQLATFWASCDGKRCSPHTLVGMVTVLRPRFDQHDCCLALDKQPLSQSRRSLDHLFPFFFDRFTTTSSLSSSSTSPPHVISNSTNSSHSLTSSHLSPPQPRSLHRSNAIFASSNVVSGLVRIPARCWRMVKWVQETVSSGGRVFTGMCEHDTRWDTTGKKDLRILHVDTSEETRKGSHRSVQESTRTIMAPSKQSPSLVDDMPRKRSFHSGRRAQRIYQVTGPTKCELATSSREPCQEYRIRCLNSFTRGRQGGFAQRSTYQFAQDCFHCYTRFVPLFEMIHHTRSFLYLFPVQYIATHHQPRSRTQDTIRSAPPTPTQPPDT